MAVVGFLRPIGSDRLINAYDKVAGSWAERLASLGYLGAYCELMRRVAERSFGQRPLRVLDAGCGTGAMSAAWLDTGVVDAELDLIDRSPAMLAQAVKQLKFRASSVRAHETDLNAIPSEPGKWDMIMSAHVIEHLADPEVAIEMFSRRLAPGGLVILVVSKPHWCTWLLQWLWHHKSFEQAQIVEFLRQAGFAEIETITFSTGPPSRTSAGYIGQKPKQ